MPTYMVLGHFTEHGIRAVRDTTQRADAIKDVGKRMGITVRETFWTLGQYDVALIADAPDDTAMTAFGLAIGALGNVRTQTMRAFSSEEMGEILHKMK
jgi:uncharacterized protein with GYD domain